VAHIEYLSRLILEICGGRVGPIDDQVTGLPERAPVSLRTDRARKIIGVDIPDAELLATFVRLGLPARQEGDRILVTPPSWRFDLQIEEDLIEEAARIWGYDRLPQRPPLAPAALAAAPESRRSVSRFKRSVAARDYQEVVNYSFVDSGLDARLGLAEGGRSPLRLLNPIAAQMDQMRTTLWGGLVENLRANLNRKASRVRLFETGRVFFADPSVAAGPTQVHGVAQPLRLALLAFGPALDEHWSTAPRAVDFFDVKGDLETLAGAALEVETATHPALHPGRSARLLLAGEPVGWLGAMHPALQQTLELPQAPILAELALDPLLVAQVPVYREVSRFPPALRDLAVVVPAEMAAARVLDEIRLALAEVPAAAVVKNVRIFDEYRGKGLENKEKSLAFRLWMQDTARTLSDADAADAVQGILAWLAQRIGARLRS
jgi:phenylalanyl-tRNA synthetase beta chain